MDITIQTLTESRNGLPEGAMVFSFTDAQGYRFSGNTYFHGPDICVYTVMHYVDDVDGVEFENFSVAQELCGEIDATAQDLEAELRGALIEWSAAN